MPSLEEALKGADKQFSALEFSAVYPVLDQFIEEHKKDPLALASFVQNEIALVDPFLHQENGVIYRKKSVRTSDWQIPDGRIGQSWENLCWDPP